MLGSIRREKSQAARSTGSGALIELLDESGFPVPLIVIEYALPCGVADGAAPLWIIEQGASFLSNVFDNLVNRAGPDANASRANALRRTADIQTDHRHREEH